jgi:cytosine/adenosine deaminase-related metal-dependent hydrolase
VVDHGPAALFPALVNAHTHLELSALKGKIPFPLGSFPEWVEVLFAARMAQALTPYIDESLRIGEAELISSGTALCADITNGDAARVSGPPAGSPDSGLASGTGLDRTCSSFAAPERVIFLELLGFNLDSIAAAMPPGLSVNDFHPGTDRYPKKPPPKPGPDAGPGAAPYLGCGPTAPVPHSVYAVSPAIISESKEWTRTRGLPFSMHVAEHPAEIEFLRSGTGFCRELLEKLGRWEPSWKPPGKTPVEYLDCLGALDSRTLLVHAVYMTDDDWALAAKRGCNVVFCPRSNRNLGSGRPWIEKAVSLGMICALGTDSLASNTDLNLFAEACFTLDEHPSIDPRRVLEMITVNPARLLGRESDYGSLEPGRKAHMLAFDIGYEANESNLAEALIQSGKRGAWKWVNRLS